MNFRNDKKFHLILFLGLVILICLGDLVEKLTVQDGYTQIKIEEKKRDYSVNPEMQHPLIKSFGETVNINGHPYLEIFSKRNSLINFFEPALLIDDPINGLLIISICLIFLVRVKNLNTNKLFTPQTVIGIKWAGFTCLVFAGVDYLRFYLINKYVLSVTENLYHLPSFTFFSSWISLAGVSLLMLYRIFQKAEIIQQEQDLTV